MESATGIALVALGTVAGAIGVTMWRWFSRGVSPMAESALKQADRLIEMQERRIALLEDEVKMLREDVRALTAENRVLRYEVTHLTQTQIPAVTVSVPVPSKEENA